MSTVADSRPLRRKEPRMSFQRKLTIVIVVLLLSGLQRASVAHTCAEAAAAEEQACFLRMLFAYATCAPSYYYCQTACTCDSYEQQYPAGGAVHGGNGKWTKTQYHRRYFTVPDSIKPNSVDITIWCYYEAEEPFRAYCTDCACDPDHPPDPPILPP